MITRIHGSQLLTELTPRTTGSGQWTGSLPNMARWSGMLVGTLFLIGTGPTVLKGLSGELTVGYWDSYYPDNYGSQQLSVSVVPEPSTWALMLLGFAGLGYAGLRPRRAISITA